MLPTLYLTLPTLLPLFLPLYTASIFLTALSLIIFFPAHSLAKVFILHNAKTINPATFNDGRGRCLISAPTLLREESAKRRRVDALEP